jgi:hypothetical protein
MRTRSRTPAQTPRPLGFKRDCAGARRWLGGARFTVGLLQQILLRTAFEARVAYVTPAGAAAAAAAARPGAPAAPDVVLHARSEFCVAPPLPAPPRGGARAKGGAWGGPPGPATPLLDALASAGDADPLDEASLPPVTARLPYRAGLVFRAALWHA